jgi:hypothetical protein
MHGFRTTATGAPCAHTSTTTKLLPKESRHHARLECSDCGAFLKFVPRPENVEKRKLNRFRLAKLQMCSGLNPWEQDFVNSIASQDNKLSPRQQAMLDRICATHLEGEAA